jgi:hypothetical protein
MESVAEIEESRRKVTHRRLLLSKQLYLHGLDHSRKPGASNKMISIHNFHNAIEIALRAIILRYEISSKKKSNVDMRFEEMLNEIDNYPGFRDPDPPRRLPFRPEMQDSNRLRNRVQHRVYKPEASAMDDWRAFTRHFWSAFSKSISRSLLMGYRLYHWLMMSGFGNFSKRLPGKCWRRISLGPLVLLGSPFNSRPIRSPASCQMRGLTMLFLSPLLFRHQKGGMMS